LKITHEIKVALLVFVAAILLYFGYNFIKGTNILSNQNQYTVIYDNVNGLLPGNEVKFNGLKIGRVESAEFIDDGSYRILVAMSIKGDVKIPKNAIAQIEAADLLGDMQISVDVSHCTPADYQNLAQDGDQLPGNLNLGMMETVTEELMPVKNKVQELMITMDSLLVVVNSIVQAGQIQNTLNSVEQTVASLQKTSQGLDQLILVESKTLHDIMQNVESMTKRLNNSSEKFNVLLDNANIITADAAKISGGIAEADFKAMSEKLETTIESASTTMSSLNTTLTKVNDSDGSLNMLLKDKKLYNNLEKTTANLDKLFLDLKENPKRYVQFSLIERKTKEEKKLAKEEKKKNK